MSPQEALQRISMQCARREYCLSEVREKLYRWEIEKSEAEKIVLQLEREEFVDENRYARAFVHDKFNYDRWGRTKIKAALMQKRISDSDIRDALSQIQSEAYMEMLTAILQQKLRSLQRNASEECGNDAEEMDYDTRQRLMRFAVSRGFEPELIFRALEDF